jgi:aldehyde:ferredoxin oxidoreductase
MNEKTNGSCGMHGRALVVDLSTGGHTVEEVPEQVYSQFLGGYGLGAWLMWKHFPPGTDALAPEACFAIVLGPLTGVKTPFSGRIQIVGKSPLTGTWADSNSGGSVASHLRNAGYDALVVKGRAAEPTLLVIRDGEVSFEPAGELWGRQIPEVFDALQGAIRRQARRRRLGDRTGRRAQARIASVMNDRYHAFGRQGFGAIYGSKNLKAIVVAGTGEVPIARPRELQARSCEARQPTSTAATSGRSCGSWWRWPSPRAGSAGCTAVRQAHGHQDRSRRNRRCASCGRIAAPPPRSRCRSRTATRRSRTGGASARATSRSRKKG